MTDRDAASRRRIRRGVIAVLQRDAKLLLIRRADGVVRGGCWCFPGGHVEPDETSRIAIRRELLEELGIEVVPEERLGAVRVPEFGYVLAVWRMTHPTGPLRLARSEIAEARWLTVEQARAIQPGLASNERVLALLGDAGPTVSAR